MTGSAFRQQTIGPQLLNHTEATASVPVTSIDDENPGVVLTADAAVTVDGQTPLMLHFFAPGANLKADTGQTLAEMIFVFFQGSSDLGFVGFTKATVASAGSAFVPVSVWCRTIPSAGAHTFSIRAYVTSTNNDASSVLAGAGGLGQGITAPMFLRVMTDPDPA